MELFSSFVKLATFVSKLVGKAQKKISIHES